MIKGFENLTTEITEEEKLWVNLIFRHFCGSNTRMKYKQIVDKVYVEQKDNYENLKIPSAPRFRKIINFIRNIVIPQNVRKAIRSSKKKVLTESYQNIFWVDATSNGYLAVRDADKILRHKKSLSHRAAAIGELVNSLELVHAYRKAISPIKK